MRYAKQVGVTLIILGVLAAGIAVFLWSGSYNVAADAPHTRLMYSAIDDRRKSLFGTPYLASVGRYCSAACLPARRGDISIVALNTDFE